MSLDGEDSLLNGNECQICLHLLIEPVTFPCNHTVCKTCYELILEHSNVSCPFCRKRLSTWSRRVSRLDGLINEAKWSEICSLFPDQVRKAQARKERELLEKDGHAIGDGNKEEKYLEDDEDDAEVKMIQRCISQPGEVREEYEKFLKYEESMMRQEKEAAEKASLELIRQQFAEELQQSEQMARDEELARQLAQEEETDPIVLAPATPVDQRMRRQRRASFKEFFEEVDLSSDDSDDLIRISSCKSSRTIGANKKRKRSLNETASRASDSSLGDSSSVPSDFWSHLASSSNESDDCILVLGSSDATGP